MKRVIIDSQSNSSFRGDPAEQAYDQRGGLCQVGREGIVVTTSQIDPAYLAYWEGIGFELPTLIEAGPFEPTLTLSELIARKPAVQKRIRDVLDGDSARLEFFCIEESERAVAAILNGIPPFCNFDFAIPFSRKPAFKRWFDEIGLMTPLWHEGRNVEDLERIGKVLLARRQPFLVKREDGTGGISCKGIFRIETAGELETLIAGLREETISLGSAFVIEEVVRKVADYSAHWEIDFDLRCRVVGIFEQTSRNFAYSGTAYPPDIPERVKTAILNTLRGRLFPALVTQNAIGCGCCDIITDAAGNQYWIDLNPRKGAIRYVHDMAVRIRQLHFGGAEISYVHEHLHVPEEARIRTFGEARERLAELLVPNGGGFVVVTNPGVIPFGTIDITAVSPHTRREAMDLFRRARQRLILE